VFAGVQFVLELAAWVNRARTVAGKTDAKVRASVIGDIAPFLDQAANQIPDRARVLLVTNESPWRARYLLLPRSVYVYHGPLPRPEALPGEFLEEQKALLAQLGISWIVSYTRTTTGPYRIIDSEVVPVATPPARPAGTRPANATRIPAGETPAGKEPAPPSEEKKAEPGARVGLAGTRVRLPVVSTLAALIVTVLAGGAVLGVMDRRRALLSYESLSLAYGLGTGCVTLALFLLSWLGFPLRWCPPVIAAVALAGLGGLAASRLRGRRVPDGSDACGLPGTLFGSPPAPRAPAKARTASPSYRALVEPAPPAGGRWQLSLLLASVLLLLFLSQGYYASTVPLNAMDAMGFWGYSAKAIFFDDTVSTPAITDLLREHPHPRYPLLVPLAQVWVHLLQGGYEDKTMNLLFVGFYVALAGVVYGAGKGSLSGGSKRSRQATQAGLVAALLVATLPPLRADGYGASSALADIPLTCYIASALLCWVRWAESDDFRTLLLASTFAAFAAWTKNEGLAFFAILSALTALRAGLPAKRAPAERARRRRGALRQAALALAGGWLLLVPWLVFQHSLPVTDENYPAHLRLAELWANLGRLPVVVLTWLRECADASQWSLLWLLAVMAACWALSRRKAQGLWLLAFGFGQLLVYTVVTVVAPWDVTELLKLTSTRLLLHVLPVAVLLSLTMVAALWTEDKRTRSPEPLAGVGPQGQGERWPRARRPSSSRPWW
jgi:hypothetical protein